MKKIVLLIIFLSSAIFSDTIDSCNDWMSSKSFSFKTTDEATYQETGWCSESYCETVSDSYDVEANKVRFYYLSCIEDNGDSSSVREVHYVEMSGYECTTTPPPDDYLTVTQMSASTCNDAVSAGSYTLDNGTTYTDLFCYIDNCAADLDTATLMAKNIQECDAMSSYPVNVPESDCSGNMDNADYGVSGTLAWQPCNNTCYMLETIPMSCDAINDIRLPLCDTTLNDYKFTCTDSDSLDVPPTFTASCTPKDSNDNNDTTTTTSDDNNDTTTTTSDDSNITSLLNENNSILDDFKNKNEEQLKDIGDKLDTSNKSLEDIGDKLDTSNKSLEDIGDKLDTSNKTLEDFKNKNEELLSNINDNIGAMFTSPDLPELNNVDDLLSQNANFIDDITSQYKEFSDNIFNQVEDLESLYKDARSMFENGFKFAPLSGSGDDSSCFSAVVFGREIKFELCRYLSVFAPIFYFIFMIIFSVKSIKITMDYMFRGD